MERIVGALAAPMLAASLAASGTAAQEIDLPNAVEVDIELAECDGSGGSPRSAQGARREICAVFCQRLGDPLRDDAPTRDLGD